MNRIEKAALFASLLALLGIASSQVHSFDIFWQLQSARHMLETGAFIYHDIFSLAADAPRFEHCWLHDLIFYGAWSAGGYACISLLKGALVAATAVLVLLTARIRAGALWPVLPLALPVFFYLRGSWLERPQLWSFLFCALFLYLFTRSERGDYRALWWLPALTVLWANLHAGAVLAVPMAAAYAVGALVSSSAGQRGRALRSLLPLLLIPLSLLVTPYGLMTLKTLVAAPFQGDASGLSTQIYNLDWRSTRFDTNPLYFYALGLTALLMLLGGRRFRFSDLLLLAGLGVMGLRLERHSTFFFLAAAALLPAYMAATVPLLQRFFPNGIRQRVGVWARVLSLGMALWMVVSLMQAALPQAGFFDLGLRQRHYPVEAARFVEQNRLPGTLYNTYDWGGYLMWTLYPEYRVFWDGRSDSTEMFDLGRQVMSGAQGWQVTLDCFEVNTIVTKACTVDTGQHYPLIDRLAQSSDWSLVFADGPALVFVRNAAVDSRWIEEHRLGSRQIEETILREASWLVEDDPRRYLGWWEIGRIQFARRDYPKAFASLEKHLQYAPPGEHRPEAEQYYRILYPMMNKK